MNARNVIRKQEPLLALVDKVIDKLVIRFAVPGYRSACPAKPYWRRNPCSRIESRDR